MKVSKHGGMPSLISTTLDQINGIALDSTYVYYTANSVANDKVLKVAKTGGALEVLASGGRPGAIAVDETNVYWVDINDQLIKRVAK
jgi:hypothetical protein